MSLAYIHNNNNFDLLTKALVINELSTVVFASTAAVLEL